MTDPFVGQLAFFRVYSGSLSTGSHVFNSTKQVRERIGRLLKMHANKREEIKDVFAGDIAAAVGLRNVTTGDTICDENKQILLEAMDFPEPVIAVAIEPKTKADQEKMGIALNKLAQEDPTFRIHTDPDTAQTIISGMGELHLEIIVDRMMREFNVGANVGKPQVAYKETIRSKANAEGKYIRQTGGRGQYGHVRITVEPSAVGAGFVFENAIVAGTPTYYSFPAIMASRFSSAKSEMPFTPRVAAALANTVESTSHTLATSALGVLANVFASTVPRPFKPITQTTTFSLDALLANNGARAAMVPSAALDAVFTKRRRFIVASL